MPDFFPPAIPLGPIGPRRWGKIPTKDARVLAACQRVGLLVMQGSRRYGQCIRVSRKWILTAHHVIDIPELARLFRVTRLGYVSDSSAQFDYRLDPADFFCSDDGIQGPTGDEFDMDYAFVRIAEPHDDADPSDGKDLSVSAAPPALGTPAWIPQFVCDEGEAATGPCLNDPGSSPRYPYAIDCMSPLRLPLPCQDMDNHGNFAVCDDPAFPHVSYNVYTEKGASGSPVFDDSWRLVGIHTHTYIVGHPYPWRRNSNWGTRIQCIVEDAKKRGFKYFHEIPCLDGLA